MDNSWNSIGQYLKYLQLTLKGLVCFRLDILLPTPGKKLKYPPNPGLLPCDQSRCIPHWETFDERNKHKNKIYIYQLVYSISGYGTTAGDRKIKKRMHNRVTFLQSLKKPRLRSIRGFKMMYKPDQRDAEQPRAAPMSSRWHPCTHCSDARAQLISNVKAMKLHRTGLWDMRGRLGIHAKDTVLRSGHVGENKQKPLKTFTYISTFLEMTHNIEKRSNYTYKCPSVPLLY